jgi:hypothetical protein
LLDSSKGSKEVLWNIIFFEITLHGFNTTVRTVGKQQNLTEVSVHYMLRVQNYGCQFDLLFSNLPEQKDVLFSLCCGWHGARVFAVPPLSG